MLPKDYGINHFKPFPTLPILFHFLLAQRQSALSTAFFFSVFSFTKQFFMVYLIHFSEKLHHAHHNIGFVDKNLEQRIKKHRSNKGANDPYLKAIGRYVDVADTEGNRDKQEAWLLYNGFAVYEEPGTCHFKIEESTKSLTAPVVILTSHITESTAEDFLIGAEDNQKHIVRIGEPTNGSTGMPYRFDLPGGGSARICIKKDMYPDGREFVGKGIQPDIRITPTVKDYLESRDVVREAALKYLETKAGSVAKSPHR
jgi:hypothetical protein